MSAKQAKQSSFKALSLLAILAGGIGIGLYLGSGDGEQQRGMSPEEIERVRSIPKPKPPIDRSEEAEVADSIPKINALKGLNDDRGDIETDVLILDHMFREVYRTFHRVPTGTHKEIVSFLQGDNERSFAYFSAENPNLNSDGKVVDRWGTPYFFHIQSRDQVEVRSAGPDRLHWSEDDVVSNAMPGAYANY